MFWDYNKRFWNNNKCFEIKIKCFETTIKCFTAKINYFETILNNNQKASKYDWIICISCMEYFILSVAKLLKLKIKILIWNEVEIKDVDLKWSWKQKYVFTQSEINSESCQIKPNIDGNNNFCYSSITKWNSV